jgi:hypothetical protein
MDVSAGEFTMIHPADAKWTLNYVCAMVLVVFKYLLQLPRSFVAPPIIGVVSGTESIERSCVVLLGKRNPNRTVLLATPR